jgi:hypothetical protein
MGLILYQIDPCIEISWLVDVLPLAFVLKTDLQVPVGPGDKGGTLPTT